MTGSSFGLTPRGVDSDCRLLTAPGLRPQRSVQGGQNKNEEGCGHPCISTGKPGHYVRRNTE